MRLILALVAVLLLSLPALAVMPDEVLADPRLEARAREISSQLRCLVCQNQSIDDSDAELARDLRVIVRERLLAGDTNDEVFEYVVDRYGEFVLLNPVLAPHTLLLWFAGPVFLIVGGIALVLALKKRNRVETVPLSSEEKAVLDELSAEPKH
ncbi:cytochrome c biogenesis protein [Devosia pacifica]|uniref:Cytochrome c-type biogenesis protein n=1 Tax=Devosia pacifica TaxID=1335967 RepID=A0A918SAE7_9HYPH|nr:cytochrome c-type biogenesis protein [Devosia pacifica]GHA29178.1 cytochrome c biogenesis protein [Devosia pacifica]